jgi:hypothetical protein
MTPDPPPLSSRLRRAAAAERADLDRHQERLRTERERLQAELDRVDAGLAEIRERRQLLDRLAPDETGATPTARLAAVAAPAGEAADGATVLRGPAIRATAVDVLKQRDDVEAVHYRDWFQMLLNAGFSVAGKDPLAVFLTQISRSPVVRRSTQSGVYELDSDAPARLRVELHRLHEQLRELTVTPSATSDLAEIRERRAHLTSEIDQAEKALEEAERLLGVAARSPIAAAVVRQAG